MLINKIRKILQFASVLIIVGSFLFLGTLTTQAAFIGNYNKAPNGTLNATDWNNLKLDFLNKDGDVSLNGNLTLPNNKSVTAGFFQGTTNALYVSSGTFGGPGGGNYSFPGDLSVAGNINFNGDLYQNGSPFITSKWLSNGTKLYYNNGNVGIGTNNPLVKLSVVGQGKFTGIVDGGTPGTTQKDAFTTVKYVDDFISGVSTSTVGFWSKLGDNIYNANSGNVGIGTDSPTSLITIANNKWLSAISSNGSSGINMFKLNTNNQIEVGAPLLIGPLEFAADSGLVSFLDMPITASSPLGTPHGYVMKIDGNNILSTYAESNGSGGINNARVGIGTATPSAKLEITGEASPSLKLTSSSNSAYNVVLQSRLDANHQMSLSVLGSEVLGRYGANTALMTGNVGIGKTNPEYKLDVLGRGKFSDIVTGHTPGTTQKDAFTTVEYIDNFISGEDRPDIIGFWTKNGNNIYNNNSANVGVGVSNPAYKLDVAGAAKFTGNVVVGGATMLTEDGTGILHFGRLGGSQTAIYSASAERIRINASGSVGIGTTAPSQKLHVNGGAQLGAISFGVTPGSSQTLALSTVEYVNSMVSGVGTSTVGYWSANGTNIYNANSGNVGIGTTAPSSKFDVRGGVNITGASSFSEGIRLHAVGGLSSVWFNAVNSSGYDPGMFGITADSTGMRFRYGSGASPSDLVNIRNNGNVGIGTTAPAGKLHIYESSPAVNDGSANPLVIKNGMVGIGTADPKRALHIAATNFAYMHLTNDETGHTNVDGFSFGLLRSGFSSDPQAFLRMRENLPVSIWTNDQERMRVTNTGNVGIGTTAPSQKLHVNGGAQLGAISFGVTPGSTQTLALATVEYVNGKIGGGVGTGSSGYTLRHNGTSWVSNSNIYNNGTNVGIGTTNPIAGSRLHIDGEQGYQAGNSFSGILNLYNTATGISGDNIGPYISFSGKRGATDINRVPYGAIGGVNTGLTGSSAGALVFLTKPATGAAQTLSEQMRIATGGNVGIGTTAPSQKLHVNGTVQFDGVATGVTGTNNLDLATVEYVVGKVGGAGGVGAGIAGQTLMHDGTSWIADSNIFNNGVNVGIGTTNPGPNKLAIDGGSLSVNGSIKGLGASNYFNGKLGINNPSVGASSLAVFGNAAIGNSYFSVNAPTNGLIVEGRLGVGTSSPSEALHVTGNARVDGGFTLGGDLNMSGNTLVVDKITANTIDPMYTISGIQYSTFASAIVGGVKEEYLGRISRNDFKKKGDHYELSMDMKTLEEGSDLWVWYRVIDFNDDNVDVFLSPKGETASMAAYVEGNKIVIRSDKKVDAYMRLIGKRFDWKKWPTKAIEQGQPGGLLID